MSTTLALVTLVVSDLTRAVRFYDHAFGWAHSLDSPEYIEYTMSNGMRLGLHERHAFGKNAGSTPILIPTGTTAPTELYLYADDLYDAEERLVSAGATLLSPMQPRS